MLCNEKGRRNECVNVLYGNADACGVEHVCLTGSDQMSGGVFLASPDMMKEDRYPAEVTQVVISNLSVSSRTALCKIYRKTDCGKGMAFRGHICEKSEIIIEKYTNVTPLKKMISISLVRPQWIG